MMTRLEAVALSALVLLAATRPAKCQRGDSAEVNRARSLIVHISGPPREAHGAGIVIGMTREVVYIATARHVLTALGSPPSVRVSFLVDPENSVEGRVVPRSYSSPDASIYDIGLISISRGVLTGKAARAGEALVELDRLADTRRLHIGERVYSVGCPHGVCWEVPADESVFGIGEHMTFVTQFVATGNSGGALLSQWGEVIGMVVQSEPPIGRAVSIDVVLDKLRSWDASVSLRRPSVPRWPYAVEVRAAWLGTSGLTQGQGAMGGLDILLSDHFGWHVGVLQLTPENQAITALVAGGSLRLRSGRFTLAPFADFGLSHLEARQDLGGYYVGSGIEQAYIPVWSATTVFGFGGGGGIRASMMVASRLSLDVLAARWSFQKPADARSLPEFYFGGGMRWGIR